MFHPDGPTFLELAQQALSSTRRGYDLLAPKFDVTPFRTPASILKTVAAKIENGPNARVLDLCCGTGAFGEQIEAAVLVGLDFSQGMLSKAGGLRVCADALEPPFAPAFDIVTCFGALGHFLRADRQRLVSAIRGVLKPGGRFVFVTAPRPRGWSRGFLLAKGFNAVMHLRNWLWSPPFIMYYLTFLMPEAERLLEKEGFLVRADEGLFEHPFERLLLVTATREG